MEDLLPVGSIIELKDGRLRMILGYLPTSPNEEQFDYFCSKVDGGLKKVVDKLEKDKDYFYLKKEDVFNVLYVGLQDEEFDLYNRIYDDYKNRLSEEKKNNKELSKEKMDEIYSSILYKLVGKYLDN